jgi:hypothetical protein
VKLHVSPPVDRDLDQRRSVVGGLGQPIQAFHAHVGQVVERGDPRRVEPQRRPEQRLELVALELLGLGEELEPVPSRDEGRRARSCRGGGRDRR